MLNKEDVYQVVQRARPPKASIVIVECTNLFSLKLQAKSQKIFYIKVKDHLSVTAREIPITNQGHLCTFLTRPKPQPRFIFVVISLTLY